MKNSFLITLIAFVVFINEITNAQIVFQSVAHNSIYEFLDEMANMKIIELNSAVKPYSRSLIAEKLTEINKQSESLNKRQKGELDFFMKDFSNETDLSKRTDYVTKNLFGSDRIRLKDKTRRHDLFFYRDSSFTISVNPILGARIWVNDSANIYHRWNGAAMSIYAGDHIGVYASLRDNYLSKDISGPYYLTRQTGGGFKNPTYGFTDRQAVEYSEMIGGITYSNKYGYIGLVKDHSIWGNNYNGANIFSGRNPSFAQIRLNIQPVSWLELNYIHGWLSSKVVDTVRTQSYGTGTTNVYVQKYMAANFLTVRPVRNLYFSIGNSIVYSRDINAGYLIPFIFYKSLDHTYSSLGNSQLFMDISVRNVKNCHFYLTGFFDDISFGRMFKSGATRPWSFKTGARVSNFVSNLSITVEYTRNDVLSYKHFNPETTFESTRYNMGHHLRDNSQDIFVQLSYKPIARLCLDASYNFSNKGPDYPDNRNEIDPVTGEEVILNLPFQSSIIWERSAMAFHARYELINDLVVMMGVEYTDIADPSGFYTPKQFQGQQLTGTAMVSFGF